MESSEKSSSWSHAYNTLNTSMKGGNIILNRFCIDEDAAFELSGVNYLKESYYGIENEEKGKEYSF